MPLSGGPLMTRQEHDRQLAAAVAKYAALLQDRLERFAQQVQKPSPVHSPVLPSLAESLGQQRGGGGASAGSSRRSSASRNRYRETPLFQRESPAQPFEFASGDVGGTTPSVGALPPNARFPPAVAGAGRYSPREAAQRFASPVESSLLERPSSSSINRRGNSGAGGAAASHGLPCPIAMLHTDHVLSEKHGRKQSLSSSAVAASMTSDGQAPASVAQTTSPFTPTEAVWAPIVSDEFSDAQPALLSPTIEVTPARSAAAGSLGEKSPTVMAGASAMLLAARARSRNPSFSAVSALSGAFDFDSAASTSRRPSHVSSSSFPADSGNNVPNDTLSGQWPSRSVSTNPPDNGADANVITQLEQEVARLNEAVAAKMSTIPKLQNEAAALGVATAAIDAVSKGQPVESFLLQIAQSASAKLTAASLQNAAQAKAATLSPSVDNNLLPPPSTGPVANGARRRPSAVFIEDPTASPFAQSIVMVGTPSAKPQPLNRQRRQSLSITDPVSPPAVVTKARSATLKATLTLTAATADTYFDAFVRDGNIDELSRLVAELQGEITSWATAARHNQPSVTLQNFMRTVATEASELLTHINDEKAAFMAAQKTIEKYVKRDRKDAEVLVDRLSKKLDALEASLAELVRDEMLSTGEINYDVGDDSASDHDQGTVERAEDETRADGVVFSTVGIQCVLQPTAVDDAIRTLHAVASKERLVHEKITQMEGLANLMDKHNAKLEKEIACAACARVRDENFVVWPCGHPLCGPCLFGSQNERGELVCPTCASATTESPIPNGVLNALAARIVVKRLGSRDLLSALASFRTHVERIDDAFRRETDAFYITLDPEDEFESFRDSQRRLRHEASMVRAAKLEVAPS